jgi:hypothetical protein
MPGHLSEHSLILSFHHKAQTYFSPLALHRTIFGNHDITLSILIVVFYYIRPIVPQFDLYLSFLNDQMCILLRL